MAGDVYVADTVNNRVEVFSAAGVFKFAFGRDVVVEGGVGDLGLLGFEKCSVAGDCKAATLGERGGEFSNPHAVAVNQATGDVYVRDRQNLRVQQFTATGVFVRAFGWDVVQAGGAGDDIAAPVNEFEVCSVASQCKTGVAGAGVGQFGSYGNFNVAGTGIAVAPAGSAAAGDVFVVDPSTTGRRVLRFNSDGTPDAVATIGSSANFASSYPQHVVVDSAGIVYASDSNSNSQIDRYNTNTSALMTSIGASTGGVSPNPLLAGGTSPSASPGNSGLAIDPDSDGAGPDEDVLYVLRNPTSGNTVVQQLGPVNDPGLAAAPTVSDDNTHAGSAFGTLAVNGLGINSATATLYLSASIGTACDGSCHGVYALDNDGTAATVGATMAPSTAIGPDGATLHGALTTPDGLVNYRFEYSKDGVNWTQFPNTRVPVSGSQDVSQTVTGLEADTTYRIRIVATKVLSPTTSASETSAELTMLTDQAAPLVTTDGAQHVAATSAQLAGRINPGGLETTYWFEWGNDSYGNTTPVPAGSAGSGGIAKAVGETIAGLTPQRLYHFRLCAHNTLAPAGNPVCGTDRTFTTRTPIAAPPGRSYEMVTDPDKPLRQGHAGIGRITLDFARANTVPPSTDGESVRWGLFPGATSGEAGHGFTWAETYEIYDRTPAGWTPEAVTKVAPVVGGTNAVLDRAGSSADLKTSAWYTQTPLFDNGSNQVLSIMGDSGGPRGAGLYPWLAPSWFTGSPGAAQTWVARIDDEGERLIGSTASTNLGQDLREIAPVDGGGSPEALGQLSGGSLILSDSSFGWRPGDLINECTGTVAGGDQTLVPTRAAGAPDTIGVRDCEQGSPTNAHGAMLGGRGHLDASSITSMSDSGDRVFFMTPDTNQGLPSMHPSARACEAGTGAATRCPPQLFVRQYADDGTATVRWISRAEDSLFDAPQQIGLYGSGVAFEGASRDGSVVYFRTSAPLTTDDPNGGPLAGRPVIAGEVSSNSWDLYRYELGGDNNADPAAGDPGDGLTRISGGPTGDADPNTNCAVLATDGPQAGNCWGNPSSSSGGNATAVNGAGGAVRFMSDDGQRVYFVTAAQIPGATNTPPDGGTTTPTAAGNQVNVASRNLYLYDADKTGAAAYEFIAKLPFSTSTAQSGDLDSCATFGPDNSGPFFLAEGGANDLALMTGSASCVHGSSSGDAIVFQTSGQLTSDDVDAAADIYLYEADIDRLTRVSAPPPGVQPYVCQRRAPTALVLERCNADLGVSQRTGIEGGGDGFGSAGLRHWNIAERSDGTFEAVYFESRLALTSDKTNGVGEPADTGGEGYMDVYEWRDGEVSLISTGDSPNSSFYSGNARDGEHVFFWTEQRISPWEIDARDGDLYNATTAEPIPGPVAPPPVCAILGGGCQGGDAAGISAAPQTSSGGDANANAGDRKTLSVAGLGAKARRRAARTGRLALRVRTSDAGKLSVTVSGTIAKRNRVLARVSKAVSGPGVTTVNLRLSAAARQALVRGRRLSLSIRVDQVGARSRSMTVLLRRAGS